MKVCTKCLRLTDNFTKNKKTIDNLASWCRACVADGCKKFDKTKDGVVKTMYGSQKQNSKRRGHIKPEYTRQELKDWLFSQELFHELYNSWKISGYEKMMKPSCDRLDDNKHYFFGNIQLMTWGENKAKQTEDFKSGKLKNSGFFGGELRRVVQIDLSGGIVAEFVSIANASRSTRINRANISSVISGKRDVAGGFYWRYKEEEINA